MAETSACDDCIVSFVANREPGDAVVVDLATEGAVRMLARGDDPKTVLEALSRGLTNKLMHAPTEALNQGGEADESLKALVARLYQLRARD